MSHLTTNERHTRAASASLHGARLVYFPHGEILPVTPELWARHQGTLHRVTPEQHTPLKPGHEPR